MALSGTVVIALVALVATARSASPQLTKDWCDRVCQCNAFEPMQRRLPPGYLTSPGIGSYKLYDEELTWKQANETCTRDGGYLAIPDTQDELDLLMALRRDIKDVHVGFTNYFTEGNFHTSIGTPMNDFQRGLWYKGYPKTAANRNAVLLYKTGKIWDYRNDVNYAFVCELAKP